MRHRRLGQADGSAHQFVRAVRSEQIVLNATRHTPSFSHPDCHRRPPGGAGHAVTSNRAGDVVRLVMGESLRVGLAGLVLGLLLYWVITGLFGEPGSALLGLACWISAGVFIQLVETGIYSLVRHPIYGGIIVIAGAFYVYLNAYLGSAARRRGIPLVYHVHGIFEPWILGRRGHTLYKSEAEGCRSLRLANSETNQEV